MAEPLNATFYAFRSRGEGGVLIGASIATLVIGLILAAALVALFWGAIADFISWYLHIISAAVANDEAALAEVGFPTAILAAIPALLLWLFFFYMLFAAYEAACLRWMVRRERKGIFGLALDADMWRVYVTYWVWFGLYLAGSTAFSIVLVAVMSVLALAGAGAGADAGGMAAGFIGATALLYVVYYGAMVFFAVRFAPAAATSIARRRFSFFDAWTVTKGRFWPLLGSFLLLWLIYCVVVVLAWTLGIGFVLGAAGPGLGDLFTADPKRLAESSTEMLRAYFNAFLQPQMWLLLGALQLIGWAAGLTLYVAMFGVNARAASLALEEGRIKPAA